MRQLSGCGVGIVWAVAYTGVLAMCGASAKAGAEEEKLFIFQLNTFHQAGDDYDATFRGWVDAAASVGCNAVFTDIQWAHVEPTAGVFSFDAYDERFDYIVSKGLKILVKMNLREKPSFLDEDEYMMYNYENEIVRVNIDYPDVGCFHFHSDYIWDKAAAFHSAVVSHFRDRYEAGTILAYIPVVSQWTEFEYPPSWGITDFSPAAKSAFEDALGVRYGSIDFLNTTLGTTFSGFDEVLPALLSAPGPESPHFSDFMAFRERAMWARVRQLANAVHGADPDAEFGLQVGSMADGSSPGRGTIGVSAVADVLDWFMFDDAPGFDHAFNTDLARTSLPNAKIINEAFGPWIDQVSLEDYLEHVEETFAHGGTGVQFANWDYEDGTVFTNGATYLSGPECATLFAAIRAELESPVLVPEAVDTIMRTVSEIYSDWFSMTVLTPLSAEYETKSSNGANPVAVIYENDYLDLYTDSDNDGLGDFVDTDDDNDGLSDTEEDVHGTDPQNADSDDDGLSDLEETVDLDPETPGVQNPFDPCDEDSTGDDGAEGPDGIPDGQNDWDGDGMSNAQESAWGFNPIDPLSFGLLPLSSCWVLLSLFAAALMALRRRGLDNAR